MAITGNWVFTASMDVDPDKEALFNEVYDTEHVPHLSKVPGVVSVARGKSDKLRFTQCVVRRPEGAREFADQGGLEVVTDFDRMLRDDRVHAVVLATPHSLHVQQIAAAAAARKAVFCEKPLALTKADA